MYIIEFICEITKLFFNKLKSIKYHVKWLCLKNSLYKNELDWYTYIKYKLSSFFSSLFLKLPLVSSNNYHYGSAFLWCKLFVNESKVNGCNAKILIQVITLAQQNL